MGKINSRAVFLFIVAVAFLCAGFAVSADSEVIPYAKIVSTDEEGIPGDEDSKEPSVSANGQQVAFKTKSTNFPDADGDSNVWVKNTVTGELTLIGVDRYGDTVKAKNGVISANGRYVAFTSKATSIVTPDTDEESNAYRRDLIGETTTLVGIDRYGDPVKSKVKAISQDGRYVFFTSKATSIVTPDTDAESNLYVRDMSTNTNRLVIVDRYGNAVKVKDPVITANGRYVAFKSKLTTLTTPDSDQDSNALFVRDLSTGTTTLVSIDRYGYAVNADKPAVSENGRYVAFKSKATTLVTPDTDQDSNAVFVRDMSSGTTRVVSVDKYGEVVQGKDPVITGDGRYVVFKSKATTLVTPDTDEESNLFLKDMNTGITTLVNVDNAGVRFKGKDPLFSLDGRFVVLQTDESLVVEDDNGSTKDLYILNVLDKNGDGVRDDQEVPGVTNTATSKTFYSYQGTGGVVNVSTSTGGAVITYVESVDPAGALGDTRGSYPDGIPQGLVSFTLNVAVGSTATVTITFPNAIINAIYKYYKYDVVNGWTDFSENAAISGKTVTLTLTDGGAGDADGIANGVIVDPSGPGTVTPAGGGGSGGCFIGTLFAS